MLYPKALLNSFTVKFFVYPNLILSEMFAFYQFFFFFKYPETKPYLFMWGITALTQCVFNKNQVIAHIKQAFHSLWTSFFISLVGDLWAIAVVRAHSNKAISSSEVGTSLGSLGCHPEYKSICRTCFCQKPK